MNIAMLAAAKTQDTGGEILGMTLGIVTILALVGCCYYLSQIRSILEKILEAQTHRQTTDARRTWR